MWKPPARGRLVQTTWALRPRSATPSHTVCTERPDAAGDANERTCFRRRRARRGAGGRGGRCLRSVGWQRGQHPDRLAPGRRAVRLAGGRGCCQRSVQDPEPGLGRRRPVPDVGHPPREVRRDAGRRQRAGRHRDGEHRDDEVHGGGRVPGPDGGLSFPNQSTWLAGLAASGRYGGKLYGVPYYAGSRVVTYRTDLFKQVNAKIPTSRRRVHRRSRRSSARRTRRRRSRRSTSRAPTGTSR